MPPAVHSAGLEWMRAMRAGDFAAAWAATDFIERDRRGGGEAQAWHLTWDGSPLDGKVVRVRCVHGLGDTLQFTRFVPLVATRARQVRFMVQPPLLELLEGGPGLGEVSTAWTDSPPDADLEMEVMELAYALRCTPGTLPPPYPHLATLALRGWKLQFRPTSRLRVGVLWAASDWDPSRSLRLDTLAPLFDVPGVEFHNLQQGPAAFDPAAAELGLLPLWRDTGEIGAAASAMLAMDLVISVDGMPAHLAGTLGRPTWLLLKHDADWRWMERRDDTPWYPTMRLFRQPAAGDWSTPVRRAAERLRALVQERGSR
jgi:hypothetical protein